MGTKSDYYKDLKEKQRKKANELKRQLPPYVIPYLDDKELHSQMNTVISYTYDLIIFFQYLKEKNPLLKDVDLNKIPESFIKNLVFQDITDYQKYLSYNDGENHHLNDERGIAQRMAPLRGFFKFACIHGYLENNPTIGVENTRKIKEKEIIRLNVDEVHEFLNQIASNGLGLSERQQKFCEKTQLRDTAIIMLMLNTGIRVSECIGLDLVDINFKDHSFVVVRKGGSSATLYFGNDVEMALQDYIDYERPQYVSDDMEEKALFLSLKKQRLSVRSVQVMVKKFSQVAVPGKKITPHKMRSTYGTALYQETGDIRLVADVLGHKDINTTAKHYAAMEEEHRKQAAKITLYKEEQE